MTTLKVYGEELSAPFRAVETFLRLNNIPFEVVPISVGSGEQKKPEFLAINPLGQIPAIKDGDFSLGESHAILLYLQEAYHAPEHFYPTDIRKRALVDQYLHWHHQNIRKATWVVFGRFLAAKIGWVLPATFDSEQISTTEKSLAMIERWLSTSQFLVGEEITLADISAFQEVYETTVYDQDWTAYPHIQDWVNRLKEIPAFREAAVQVDAFKAKVQTQSKAT